MNGTSIITLVVCLIAGVILGGCATGKSIPQQIPQTMKASCDLFTAHKPDIIAARAYLKEHWNDKIPGTDRDLIPAEVKAWALKLDAVLPELDKAGQLLCAASTSLEAFQQLGGDKKVDWDAVLSTVVKGVALGIELKQKGAF
jgi:hypothetical protein